MIEVRRPCHSPACRGEERRQIVSCDRHPDSVECAGTCADRLADRESRCTCCGGVNSAVPPATPPFPMERALPTEAPSEPGRNVRRRKERDPLPHEADASRPPQRAPEPEGRPRSGRRGSRTPRRPRRGPKGSSRPPAGE